MKVLIIGAGVTGICLAHELAHQQCKVTVMDNNKNVSSLVSAGMITPLVFRRMTLSWRVAEMMPYARKVYSKMEEDTHTKFLHELPMRRLFASEQELEFWKEKQELPEFQPFMEQLSDDDINYPLSQNTFGTGRVKQACYIDTASFIHESKNLLKRNNGLREETFDFDKLDATSGSYNQEQFDYIVFADGKDMLYNPLFSFLPMQPTKGELLTLHSEKIYNKESLNRKCFLLPLENHTFKAGSTYDWDVDNTIPTEEGKNSIKESLLSVTNEAYSIIDHQAGVRPTVPDRRPLLGKHPKFPKMVVANGMGAKGYLIAPLLMHELANHLLHNASLNKEVSISRFE